MEAGAPSLWLRSELCEPCLLITQGDCIDLHHIATNSTHHHHKIPALVGKKVCYAYYEWMVLKDLDSPDCCLFNLVSQERIQLPPVSFSYNLFILTSHPTDPACRVVLYDTHKKALVFCRPGDGKFVRQKTIRETTAFTVAAGKIYFLSEELRDMSCVEFEDSTCSIRQLNLRSRDWTMKCRMSCHELFYLAAYSGEFFLVRRCFYEDYNDNLTRFEVFKADFSRGRGEWVEVKSIAPLTIFITQELNGMAHMCSPTSDSGIMSNAIYFLEENDLDYYAYRLDEESITMYEADCVPNETALFYSWVALPRDTHLLQRDHMEEGNKLKEEVVKQQDSAKLEDEEESWANLPPELLREILSRLFSRDYAVFGVVCKSWQQIPPQLSSYPISSPSILQQQEESNAPQLMFLENRDVPVYKLFDPIHRKYQRLEIPELKGAEIRYSKHGWLLVSRKSDLFFLNPFTQEKIEIPSQPFFTDTNLYFSSPPTSSDCLIVAVLGFPNFVYFITLKRSANIWRVGKYLTERRMPLLLCSSPVVHNGLHYYACQDRRVVAFDFSGDKVTLANFWSTSLRRDLDNDENRYTDEDFMVEVDGVPTLVIIPRDGAESFGIFKWDLIRNDWAKMEDTDLVNKDMFLSRRSSFLKKDDYGGGMGNKIFLSLVDTDAMDGVFYSLKTHMYHTFYSGYSRKNYHCAAKFLDGIWVEPLYTRSEDNLTW